MDTTLIFKRVQIVLNVLMQSSSHNYQQYNIYIKYSTDKKQSKKCLKITVLYENESWIFIFNLRKHFHNYAVSSTFNDVDLTLELYTASKSCVDMQGYAAAIH